MLLRQLYELKHYNLVDGPLEWREALREGIKPLVADGSVEERDRKSTRLNSSH